MSGIHSREDVLMAADDAIGHAKRLHGSHGQSGQGGGRGRIIVRGNRVWLVLEGREAGREALALSSSLALAVKC